MNIVWQVQYDLLLLEFHSSCCWTPGNYFIFASVDLIIKSFCFVSVESLLTEPLDFGDKTSE